MKGSQCLQCDKWLYLYAKLKRNPLDQFKMHAEEETSAKANHNIIQDVSVSLEFSHLILLWEISARCCRCHSVLVRRDYEVMNDSHFYVCLQKDALHPCVFEIIKLLSPNWKTQTKIVIIQNSSSRIYCCFVWPGGCIIKWSCFPQPTVHQPLNQDLQYD